MHIFVPFKPNILDRPLFNLLLPRQRPKETPCKATCYALLQPNAVWPLLNHNLLYLRQPVLRTLPCKTEHKSPVLKLCRCNH